MSISPLVWSWDFLVHNRWRRLLVEWIKPRPDSNANSKLFRWRAAKKWEKGPDKEAGHGEGGYSKFPPLKMTVTLFSLGEMRMWASQSTLNRTFAYHGIKACSPGSSPNTNPLAVPSSTYFVRVAQIYTGGILSRAYSNILGTRMWLIPRNNINNCWTSPKFSYGLQSLPLFVMLPDCGVTSVLIMVSKKNSNDSAPHQQLPLKGKWAGSHPSQIDERDQCQK